MSNQTCRNCQHLKQKWHEGPYYCEDYISEGEKDTWKIRIPYYELDYKGDCVNFKEKGEKQ